MASGRELVETVKGGGLPIVICKLACAEMEVVWSVTVTMKLQVPVAVGVPLMTPLDVSRDNPGGKLPLETVQE